LDKFDHQILALLVDNARLSVSQIAREVNLSRSATTERIRSLESQGAITGYHAALAEPEHGRICAYFELDFNIHDSELHTAALKLIPEIRSCHAISGQVDMFIYVEAYSMARLEAIREQLESMAHMVTVRTHMVLREMFSR
jgi:DNA-binding Lrp family transcriptional regulator